jgi:tRNA (cmo5U34)-methyltransferase
MTQQLMDPQANHASEVAEPDSLVVHYDEAVFMAVPGYEVMHTMALACLQAYLPTQANVLAVGCGTGTEIMRLGQANPHWQFLGIDPSADMLALARKKVADPAIAARVTLQQGLTRDLPTDVLYDAATSIMVLHFVPSAEKLDFLKSISARLHPSAPLVITTLRLDKASAELEVLMPALQAYWQANGLPAERIEEVVTGFQTTVNPTPEPELHALLEAAGFQTIVRFYTGLWVGGWLAFKA